MMGVVAWEVENNMTYQEALIKRKRKYKNGVESFGGNIDKEIEMWDSYIKDMSKWVADGNTIIPKASSNDIMYCIAGLSTIQELCYWCDLYEGKTTEDRVDDFSFIGHNNIFNRIGIIEPENTLRNQAINYLYNHLTTLQKFKNWGVDLKNDML